MNNYTPDPQVDTLIVQIANNLLCALLPPRSSLATTTGINTSERKTFLLPHGGFGVLQCKPSDQTVTYSPHEHVVLDFRRHICNIWYANDELGAIPQEKWVIEVFSQDDESTLEEICSQLAEIAEGQITFTLLRHRGPMRPERTLADLGIGVHK